jgi:hypothetical protein
MLKLTRRFKNNKKNKTIKKGGSTKKVEEREERKEREGIFDAAGNTILNTASSAAINAADFTLGLAGYERKDQSDKSSNEINVPKPHDTSPSFISNAIKIADKAGGILLDNINEVLDSDAAKQTTLEAAKGTAKIVKETASKFNDALSEPEIKAQIEEAVVNAGKLSGVIIKAGKEPVKEAVGVAAESAQKATSAALTGAVRVGTDTMAAVPYVGAIINLGKAINNASIATSAISEAGSDVAEATADAVIQTKANVKRLLHELEEKKKIGGQISNRTNNSIYEFENPGKITGGGVKTRRKLFKRYTKSKRVKFAI